MSLSYSAGNKPFILNVIISSPLFPNNRCDQVVSLTTSQLVPSSNDTESQREGGLSSPPTAGIWALSSPRPGTRGRRATCLQTQTDVTWHWSEP